MVLISTSINNSSDFLWFLLSFLLIAYSNFNGLFALCGYLLIGSSASHEIKAKRIVIWLHSIFKISAVAHR